jgi:CRISPR-associated protein Csx10
MTRVLEVRLKGALLLGAGRSREIHDATLRRPSGAPYIPASALKGAIREQLVRLSSEEDARRILGGRGFRQDLDPAKLLPQDVAPASVAPERVGGGYTRVYLGDADLDEAGSVPFREGLGYTVRAQVSIDRRGRRAAHQRLFQRQVFGSRGEEVVFRAPVDTTLLEPTDTTLFEGAVRSVFALGSSRTRGLGWVELELVADGSGSPAPEPRRTVPEATELEVVFEALEPLSLGALPFVGNFQPTLDYLAASTVRGAVATAAMRHRGIATDQSGDPGFRELLLDPETCVRFGDAAPTDAARAGRPAIAPLTLRVGKYGGATAGVADTLVRDHVQQRLADAGVLQGVVDQVDGRGGKSERAVHPSGRWLGGAVPERRVMTRLALDPESARGKDGALYSVELLESGTRFVATVENAGPEARRLLEDAAALGLRAGHGRGQGYGRLRIDEIRERKTEPLRERLEAFDDLVRSRLATAGAAFGVDLPPADGRYVAALLVTELVPAAARESGAAEEAFHEALGLHGSRLLHGEVRAAQRGGFDTTAGQPRPFGPVVRAGSVLLLTIPAFDDPALDRLTSLERHGVGGDRDRGFGAVRFSDPVHLQGDSP